MDGHFYLCPVWFFPTFGMSFFLQSLLFLERNLCSLPGVHVVLRAVASAYLKKAGETHGTVEIKLSVGKFQHFSHKHKASSCNTG